MTRHIHADSIMEYAHDAQETDSPWKRWQYQADGDGRWNDCFCSPSFISTVKYRRRPKTIRIGEHDVPEPMRVAPPVGTEYWSLNLGLNSAYETGWNGDDADYIRLRKGLCFSTQEGAEKAMKAIYSLLEPKK